MKPGALRSWRLAVCALCGAKLKARIAADGLVLDACERILARHRATSACKIQAFARIAEERGLVRVGKAWPLLKAGAVPHETGPTKPDPGSADAGISYGLWIPRWAAYVWAAFPLTPRAIQAARILAAAGPEACTAFVVAYEQAGAWSAIDLVHGLERRSA